MARRFPCKESCSLAGTSASLHFPEAGRMALGLFDMFETGSFRQNAFSKRTERPGRTSSLVR